MIQAYFWKFIAFVTTETLMYFWTRVFGSFILGLPIFVFAYTMFQKSQRPPGKPRVHGDEEWFLDNIVYEGAKYWLIIHAVYCSWRIYSLHVISGTILGFTQLFYIPYVMMLAIEAAIFLQLLGKSRNNPPFKPEETIL